MQIVCNVFFLFFHRYFFDEQDANIVYYFNNIVINLPKGRPAIIIFSNASFLTMHLLF